MKTYSNIKPKGKFLIDNIENNKCTVLFYDNIEEIEEEENISYSYDLYSLEIEYREELEETIKANVKQWLEKAKNIEYETLAQEIRTKRDELLQETDKEMCIDRLSIEIPEKLTSTNLLSNMKKFFEEISVIFNSDKAKYRQSLRDITKQEGFPYKVEFPEKPKEREEK